MARRRISGRIFILLIFILVCRIVSPPISISESGQDPLKPIGPPRIRSIPSAPQEAMVIPGDYVIKYSKDLLPSEKMMEKRDSVLRKLAGELNGTFGSETIAIYPEMGWVRIQLLPSFKPDAVESALTQNKKIEYWMRNYAVTLHGPTKPPPHDWLWNNHFPNDSTPPYPGLSYLWGADIIGMHEGWKLSDTHVGRVLIAILDTGIDLEHPDLMGNYVPGKAFCSGGNNTKDKNGHGTHIAGIIGAKGDNGKDPGPRFFVGVNQTARILPLKIDCKKDLDSGPNIADAVAGINYAVSQGASVINGSWGFYGLDKNDRWVRLLKEAILAGKDTSLYIASAGNEQQDFNKCVSPTIWPQMFSLEGLDNLMVVAATTPKDELWKTGVLEGPDCNPTTIPAASNYGDSVVHLAAPGENIWGLGLFSNSGNTGDPIRDFVYVASGTSVSAPFVSGCAALVQSRQLSLNPGSPFTPNQLRTILMTTGTPSGGLGTKVVNGMRLNCHAALQQLKSTQ
jgi:subtilisin family serine protease